MKILDMLEEITYPHASVDDTMLHIRELMRREKLNYLPLLDDNGHVFGIIDSQVIAESYESDTPEAAQNAWELCDRHFKEVSTDSTIAETVLIMHKMGVSFVIVANEGCYIGAVTSHLLADKLSNALDVPTGSETKI